MPVSANEISNINFSAMLGKPLTAIIDAQASAALSTIDFINEVGLNPDDGKVKNVEFKYSKGGEEVTLSTPLLTIVPIPFIRIADTTIDFNAKISSVTKQSETSGHKLTLGLDVSARWGWGRAKFTGRYSYQKKKSNSDEAKRTFSMHIRIHAVQDEMPDGMSKVLDILEGAISEE